MGCFPYYDIDVDMHMCVFVCFSLLAIIQLTLLLDSGSKSFKGHPSKHMTKFKIEDTSGYISTCLWIVQHSSQKHKALFISKSKLFYYIFGATSIANEFSTPTEIRKQFYFSFLLFCYFKKVFFLSVVLVLFCGYILTL